jgi:hypothetical protein
VKPAAPFCPETLSDRVALDGKQVPLARDALEDGFTSVLEPNSRAGDEIPDGVGDEHLAGVSFGRNSGRLARSTAPTGAWPSRPAWRSEGTTIAHFRPHYRAPSQSDKSLQKGLKSCTECGDRAPSGAKNGGSGFFADARSTATTGACTRAHDHGEAIGRGAGQRGPRSPSWPPSRSPGSGPFAGEKPWVSVIRALWGPGWTRLPVHGGNKYCHNGGMVFAHEYAGDGPGVQEHDDGPFVRSLTRSPC